MSNDFVRSKAARFRVVCRSGRVMGRLVFRGNLGLKQGWGGHVKNGPHVRASLVEGLGYPSFLGEFEQPSLLLQPEAANEMIDRPEDRH